MSSGNTAGGTDNQSIKEINETLKELSEKIQKSNESSAKLNTAIFWLTIVGVTIAVIEFITRILPKIFTIFKLF